MRRLLTQPTSLVWVVLMVATVVTTWGLSKEAFGAQFATITIFIIAAIKVRLVLVHFMELRHAPLPLRLVFESWVLVVTAAVIGLYLKPIAAVAGG